MAVTGQEHGSVTFKLINQSMFANDVAGPNHPRPIAAQLFWESNAILGRSGNFFRQSIELFQCAWARLRKFNGVEFI
jgi:hypothetical protein